MDSPYAWGVVAMLMAAQSISYVDRMIMGLMVGPVRKSFQISDTQFSLLAGLAFSIFYALMGLPLGRLIDSGRRVGIVSAAMAAWSAMTMACGLTTGFWSLFLARIGVGVGEAALSPAANSIISDYFSRGRLARALSVYMVGVTIGSGLAYMIGGWVVGKTEAMGQVVLPLVGAREGWQLVFFIVGAPGLLAALLMLAIREPQRRGLLAEGGGVAVPRLSSTLAWIWTRRGAYGPHLFGMGLFIMAVASVNVWGPEYMIRTFGLTRAEAGLRYGAVMIVAGTAGLFTGSILADRWFARGVASAHSRTILVSMAGMLPCCGLLAFAPTWGLGLTCIGAAVYFSAFQGGLAGTVVQLMTPNQMRGQATAVYLLVTSLMGMGLGPTLLAAVTDFVFASDAALSRSLSVFGVTVIPVAALVMWTGLKRIDRVVDEARHWAGA